MTSLDYATNEVNTLYRCDYNQWCCSQGGNITSCCNDPNVYTFPGPTVYSPAMIYIGTAFAPGYTLSLTTASTNTASAPTASATRAGKSEGACPINSSEQSNNTCPVPSNKEDNNDTTKVVGVGVGIGVPLLAALAATLFLWSREKKRTRELQQQAANGGLQQLPWGKPSTGYGPSNGMEGYQQRPHEIGDIGVREMAATEEWREMPGNSAVK
ncbi:MAG: hypothetical protein Q9166_007476 [cf. Caloplaca sp. 2 TL-2023]